tara:strand:- start:266 stop:412 length:147 start_codon:yes stop_codon:yes gene_type:complete
LFQKSSKLGASKAGVVEKVGIEILNEFDVEVGEIRLSLYDSQITMGRH